MLRRLLLCLPVFFVLIPDSSSTEPPPPPTFRPVADTGAPLPDTDALEQLAKTDPIEFLKDCIRRYDREVKGYTATLRKQERIGRELQRSELIDVAFREDPFSVRMKWREGARRAAATLFVKGQNNDQALVLPAGPLSLVGVVKRDPYGPDARKESRYPLTQFGIKIGTQRTLASWEKAQKDNSLHVEYLGKKRIKEAGDRLCYVLKRTRYRKPEENGIIELTLYVDVKTWLQVGSVLKAADNKLIAEYFFRDIHLNPHFPPDAFTAEGLKK